MTMVRAVRAALAMVGMLVLASCGAQTEPGHYVLRYASPYTPGHPLSRADQTWMRWIERASGGRIEVRPSWAGGLISSEHNMVELRHGVADVATITPIYAKGGTHAIRGQAGFYGGERSIDQQVAVYRCLAAEFPVLNQEVAGLHVLAVQGGNVLGIVTRGRPVRRLEDLRGMRLRAPGELVPLLRELGADPLDMPMSDVYPAMAKGVIDGVVAPADTLKSLHFGEVARYFNQVRIARGGYPARAIGFVALRRLPPDLQAIVRRSQTVWEAAIARELGAAETSGAAYGRSEGMQFVPFDPASQARFDRLYNAQAARAAQHLRAFGIDGGPIFGRAQAVLAAINAGRPPDCAVATSK
ncbi:ABC transporter substrate-binding protein [Sphingomonas sp. Leaf357]|uniref:ABC transporter substrate-binding protein n=1 Tax=Sphingomonas sp. Leaf357 TaxID=1736350 RepID=UPI000B08A124|nr:ABC transporter substrate-binding protein [Sphingomonas sp. Leaf357]